VALASQHHRELNGAEIGAVRVVDEVARHRDRPVDDEDSAHSARCSKAMACAGRAAGAIKVRSIGVSIHDRPRAGRLAEDSPLDLFMIRYNAAHPGAEKDIFPHLEKRKPSVIAYTATAWRKLLKPPKGWTGPTMTAGDCYRFCLSNPNIDVVLQGPASAQQFDENFKAVEKGPLSEDEAKWMREYGRLAHG